MVVNSLFQTINNCTFKSSRVQLKCATSLIGGERIFLKMEINSESDTVIYVVAKLLSLNFYALNGFSMN